LPKRFAETYLISDTTHHLFIIFVYHELLYDRFACPTRFFASSTGVVNSDAHKCLGKV
jgi:hypothetical protein